MRICFYHIGKKEKKKKKIGKDFSRVFHKLFVVQYCSQKEKKRTRYGKERGKIRTIF